MTAYLTQQAVERFAAALQADTYNIRLLNPETDEARAFPYTSAQLTSPKTVAFLRLQNQHGFNVYARPVGWQYVLLDDLTRPALADLKADDVRPCLLIETSPDNFQAWLILPDIPADRAEAKAVCRSLAGAYRADLASAEPDHVGRLPGFTNRKPKYRQANGYFPFVKLHRAAYRLANFSTPLGGCVLTNTLPQPNGRITEDYANRSQKAYRHHGVKDTSESGRDFGIVKGLLLKNWPDERIAAHLRVHSPNIAGRHRNIDKYIATTIKNVRRTL